jgi:uncharacterized phage protein (TIGR01671 family)
MRENEQKINYIMEIDCEIMNNIHFRAWHKKDKRMCSVREINFKEETITADWDDDKKYRGGTYFEMPIKYFVITQSTGIKDRSGEEIFEGDILDEEGFRPDDRCYGEVYWDKDNGRWEIKTLNLKSKKNGFGILADYMEKQIIGNIYENPKLVKKYARIGS